LSEIRRACAYVREREGREARREYRQQYRRVKRDRPNYFNFPESSTEEDLARRNTLVGVTADRGCRPALPLVLDADNSAPFVVIRYPSNYFVVARTMNKRDGDATPGLPASRKLHGADAPTRDRISILPLGDI